MYFIGTRAEKLEERDKEGDTWEYHFGMHMTDIPPRALSELSDVGALPSGGTNGSARQKKQKKPNLSRWVRYKRVQAPNGVNTHRNLPTVTIPK